MNYRDIVITLLRERDGETCGICGEDIDDGPIEIDHLLPISFGGSDLLENLRLTHWLCNRRRGNGDRGGEGRAARIEKMLAFIDTYWVDHWTSPTVREICDHMGWASTSTGHSHLLSLVRDGHLIEQRLSDKRVFYRRAVPA